MINPSEWTVSSNDGTNIVSKNNITHEVFSGTLAAYNRLIRGLSFEASTLVKNLRAIFVAPVGATYVPTAPYIGTPSPHFIAVLFEDGFPQVIGEGILTDFRFINITEVNIIDEDTLEITAPHHGIGSSKVEAFDFLNTSTSLSSDYGAAWSSADLLAITRDTFRAVVADHGITEIVLNGTEKLIFNIIDPITLGIPIGSPDTSKRLVFLWS